MRIGFSTISTCWITFGAFSLGPSFPLILEVDAEWTSRYPAHWLLPGAVNGLMRTDCATNPETCETLETILSASRSDIVQDLVERAPNILIVDKRPLYFKNPFDYHSFLQSDPRFGSEIAKFRVLHSGTRFGIWARK